MRIINRSYRNYVAQLLGSMKHQMNVNEDMLSDEILKLNQLVRLTV